MLRPGGRVSIYATDASAMQKWKFAGPETHRRFDAGGLASTLTQGGFSRDAITVAEAQITANILGLVATIRG